MDEDASTESQAEQVNKHHLDLLATYRRFFRTEDVAPLDASLATVATREDPGDPLWMYLVAPPSSGKTEITRALEGPNNGTYFLSNLTPNALVSGLPGGKDLLAELDLKTLVIKDFTVILKSSRNCRDAILGQLRDCYDGSYAKAFGSQRGTVSYKSRFNLVAAVTGAIEEYYTVGAILGQRFLMVRMSFPEEFDADGERDIARIRATMKAHIARTLRTTMKNPPASCCPEYVQHIKSLARDVALLRTHVSREGSYRDITSLPESEAPARLTNQLVKLGRGLARVRGEATVTRREMEVVRRVAYDTVPRLRTRMLEAIRDGIVTIDGLVTRFRLARPTVERKLEDLMVLGALTIEDTAKKPHYYRFARGFPLFPASGVVQQPSVAAARSLGLPEVSPHFVDEEARRGLTYDGKLPLVFGQRAFTIKERIAP